ncbi:HipA domain-containing protein [Peptoniphilus sp. GNH]|nr:HipA domain-containing protein [Peptoniphilus sp. GNH]
MIDFSNCKINKFRGYGGNNGSKISIIYDNNIYMLKFQPRAKNNKKMSYSNGCISEYLGSNIFNIIGIKAQETILGIYKDKMVVACKDFNTNGFSLMEFAQLKNQIIDSSESGYGTELDSIIETINEQTLIDPKLLESYFWDMFIVDALIGNFDRHNGNWGILVNEDRQIALPAPIYDCGSCLFPQITEKGLAEIIKSKEEIENRVYTFPNSMIKINNVKINYFNFLLNTNNKLCLKSLFKIGKRINLYKINKLIDNTDYMTDLHKGFIKKIIKERKEKIIDFVIKERSRNIGLEEMRL